MAQRPYGNDFIVGTPYLDKMGERLYAEERQRDLIRQKEMSDLDGLVNKEVGKMRSADTGDFIRKYQEYKNLRIKGLRDKNIQKDPEQLNKLNQEANIKLAEAMQFAQQSAELKDLYKNLATQRAKDPNSFQDDFLDRYSTAMNTPISSLRQHPKYGDLADLNGYAYQGGNTDFSKQFKEAEGIQRDLAEVYVGEDPNDKLKNKYNLYKGKNNPYDFYNTLVQGVVGSKRTRDFPLQYKYSPDQEAAIEAQFNKLVSDPNYKKIYGLTEQNFPASAYNTEVGRTARLKAMEYAINNPPSERLILKDNKTAVMDRQEAFKEKMFKAREAGINARARMNQSTPGLGDYDIFGKYSNKFRPKTVTIEAGGIFTEPKTQDAIVILAKDVDGNDKKLIGETDPYQDEKGEKYFVVRDDGDWEGKGGQVISRANAARKNMDATSITEAKRGRLSPNIVPSGSNQKRSPKDIKNTKMVKKDPLGLGL